MFENKKIQQNRPAIGIDVGGTKISVGLVQQGKLIKSHTLPTPVNETKEKVLETIINTVKALGDSEFSGIGVGIPGLVDTLKGVVFDVHNIPSFTRVALKTELESAFHRRAEINNDANCFVLGSKHYGKGKRYNNMVGLTLGTGLGGGIILNGRLYEGVGAGAGEFGFLPYKNSILEHYCSGQFFQRQYNITGKEASQRALEGDTDALQMFWQFGTHLGEAIKMIAHVFAPEAVMLGGSISWSFDLFKESMWTAISKFPYKHVIDDLVVMPALGPEIALVGAAFLVLNQN